MIQLSFDIGGTFTDFVVHDENGGVHFWKALSTPAEPSRGVIDGLKDLFLNVDIDVKKISNVMHATTIAGNAIIERKGASVALLTTRGFRDVIILGRQKRYDTYDLYADTPQPLLSRNCVYEVDERVDAYGEIVDPLSIDSVKALIPELKKRSFEAVAVCLIHSYTNPDHEKAIREILAAELPGVNITLSSDISPKIREFERTSTTVANAYVQPIVKSYIDKLDGALKDLGVDASLLIMQSSGGLVTPELAGDYPIRIVESGPAAGVLMSAKVGLIEGHPYVFTFDMGGTTAKLGAVDDGEPAIMTTFEIAQERFKSGSGLPLNVSSVELLEIGAGGGSIAKVSMGMIQVGPESAGASPGPICYGLGGEQVTITDANLVLGYLNPGYFNGGAMSLKLEAAKEGIRTQIAEPLGLSVGDAAWGIHRMANSNMEQAMRVVSVERGRIPKDYALVAFGGAGPLHAARLARELGVPKLIIPNGAGVGSAVGLLSADRRVDVSLSRVAEMTPQSSGLIREVYEALEKNALEDISKLSDDAGKVVWSRYAYMRYSGQGHERKVDLPAGEIGDDYASRVIEEFSNSYKKNYGYLDPDAIVESVDWYLVGVLPSTANFIDVGNVGVDTPESKAIDREAYFPESDGYEMCKVVNRYQLKQGEKLVGPAIIEERESTTIILSGDVATVSEIGSLIIEIKKGR